MTGVVVLFLGRTPVTHNDEFTWDQLIVGHGMPAFVCFVLQFTVSLH